MPDTTSSFSNRIILAVGVGFAVGIHACCLETVREPEPDGGSQDAGTALECFSFTNSSWSSSVMANVNTTGQHIMHSALGIASLDGGALLVADISGQILEATPDGEVRVLATVSGSGLICGPTSVAAGPNGAIYATDTCTGAIAEISQDGGQTIVGSTSAPSAIAVGETGSLYLVDLDLGTLFEVEADGGLTIVSTGLDSPRAAVADFSGGILVSDRCALRRIDAKTGAISWQLDLGASCGPQSTFATSLAIGPSGAVYGIRPMSTTSSEVFSIPVDGGISFIGTIDPCSSFFGWGMAATSTDLYIGGGVLSDGDGGWISDLHPARGSL